MTSSRKTCSFKTGGRSWADFGIALAVTAAGGARLTETGLSLGTPAYMSPEQATGDRVVDGRTDIYALGCLLYEMLAGQPPHVASTAQAVLAKVLTAHPERLGRNEGQSPGILTWRSKRRWSGFLLTGFGARTCSPGRSREPWSWQVPATRGDGLGSAWLWRQRPSVHCSVTSGGVHTRVRSRSGRSRPAVDLRGCRPFASTISERPVRGVRSQHLWAGESCRATYWVQDLEGGDPIRIRLNIPDLPEGVDPWYAFAIEWSPDESTLVISVRHEEARWSGLYLVPRFGGMAEKLDGGFATSSSYRPNQNVVDWIAWPDGFEGEAHWRSLDLDTDSLESRVLPFRSSYHQWSLDGRWLALIGEINTAGVNVPLRILNAEGELQDERSLPQMGGWPRAQWGSDGEQIYFSSWNSTTILRIGIDPNTGKMRGELDSIASGLGEGEVDVTPDGRRAVYTYGDVRTELRFEERGADGRITQGSLPSGVKWRRFPAISPDGDFVAFTREDLSGINIYIQDLEGGDARAVTGTRDGKERLRWSPDGEHIAYVRYSPDGNWTMTASRSADRPQTVGRIHLDYSAAPAWLPDSREQMSWILAGAFALLHDDLLGRGAGVRRISGQHLSHDGTRIALTHRTATERRRLVCRCVDRRRGNGSPSDFARTKPRFGLRTTTKSCLRPTGEGSGTCTGSVWPVVTRNSSSSATFISTSTRGRRTDDGSWLIFPIPFPSTTCGRSSSATPWSPGPCSIRQRPSGFRCSRRTVDGLRMPSTRTVTRTYSLDHGLPAPRNTRSPWAEARGRHGVPMGGPCFFFQPDGDQALMIEAELQIAPRFARTTLDTLFSVPRSRCTTSVVGFARRGFFIARVQSRRHRIRNQRCGEFPDRVAGVAGKRVNRPSRGLAFGGDHYSKRWAVWRVGIT